MQSQGANVITLMGLIRVFQGKRGTGESDRRRRDDRGRERELEMLACWCQDGERGHAMQGALRKGRKTVSPNLPEEHSPADPFWTSDH